MVTLEGGNSETPDEMDCNAAVVVVVVVVVVRVEAVEGGI